MNNRRNRSRSPFSSQSNRDNDRGRRQDRKASKNRFAGRAPSQRQIFISNIPFEMNWQELKDIFRENVGDIGFVHIFCEQSGKSTGTGLIEFTNPDSVNKALAVMDKYEINGRRLVVKEDYEVERDEQGKPLNNGSANMGRGSAGNGHSERRHRRSPDCFRDTDNFRGDCSFQPELSNPSVDTYGLSESFLGSLGIQGPLINRVFISNIDYCVDENKLRDVFCLAGKLQMIDFKTDNNGKSRGRAIIKFEHPVEAVQAISMFDGQTLFDRVLSVKMDKLDRNPSNAVDGLPAGLKSIGLGLGANGLPMDIKKTPDGSMEPPSNMGLPSGPPSNIGMPSGSPRNMGMPSSPPNVPRTDRNINSAGPSLSLNASNVNQAALAALTQQQLISLLTTGILGGVGTANPMVAPNLNAPSPIINSIMKDPVPPINSTGVAGLSGIGQRIGNSHSSSSSHRFSDAVERRYKSNDIIRPVCVVVRNFPHRLIWQDLRDKFYDVGDVIDAQIISPGHAIIKFRSPQDAERAINIMHGTRIDGRTIDVELLEFIP